MLYVNMKYDKINGDIKYVNPNKICGIYCIYNEQYFYVGQSNNVKNRCPISQYSKDGKYIQTFNSMYEAQKQTGISQGSINNVIKGIQKSVGGFIWKRN